MFRCPFCLKEEFIAVYRGPTTTEEREAEAAEEEAVNQLKLKMRMEEIEEDKRRMERKRQQSLSSDATGATSPSTPSTPANVASTPQTSPDATRSPPPVRAPASPSPHAAFLSLQDFGMEFSRLLNTFFFLFAIN